MAQKKTLLLGTRKGLIVYKKSPSGWKFSSHSFLGIPVSIAAADSRTGTWWAFLDHGHWGQKLNRSDDKGKTWTEVEAPKYPKGALVKENVEATLRLMWAFAEAGKDKPNTLFIGTEPGGLFQSNDGGKTFQLNKSLWNQPTRMNGWFGGGRDYPAIHSILVDPKDSNHIHIAISCAGVFETKDGGKNWEIRNKGLRADFLPDPNAEVGQDPHILVASPSNRKVMWQQNHCGVYRSVDGGLSWTDISGKKGSPVKFGFCIAADEKDDKVAWVVPAVSDGCRVVVDGALCVCRTDDGGKSWKVLRKGLPQKNVYDIAFRHALDITGDTLVFGTTTGNLYLSENRGESWKTLNNNLPLVHSVKFI